MLLGARKSRPRPDRRRLTRRQPTAAEIAAMPFESPDEERISYGPPQEIAAAINAEKPLRDAFMKRTAADGQVVCGIKLAQIARLREIGAVLPDRMFLTPAGIAARPIVVMWQVQRERTGAEIVRRREAKKAAEAKPPQGDRLGTAEGEFCNLGGCCGRLGKIDSMFLGCNGCGQIVEVPR